MGSPPAATSSRGRAVAHVLLHTLALLSRVLATAACLVLAAWLLVLGTRKYTEDKPWRVFPPDYGCDDRLLLDTCTVKDLVFMWLLPAVLAFSCLGLLALRAALNNKVGEHDGRKGPLGRLSTRLLPPKRFWLWWCGGLSVSDALAVAFWAAFNASWAVAVLSRFFSLIPFFSKVSPHPVGLELQLVAVAFGVFLLPNFVLLFYPVTRGSVVLQACGLSYPDAIRYHRWLGHAVMVMASAHSLGFWGIWLYQGVFLKEAFDQGPVFNNLAGGVSFLGGLALWLSSLEVARRSNYELFYKLHHVGFWVFMFAGCCHYWEMFWYFLPGMLLYAVDGVYRIHQGLGFWGSSTNPGGKPCSGDGGCVAVLEAVVSPGKTTCSLLLAAPRFGVSASGFVWLNVPDISWHSWHPFEYFAVPVKTLDTHSTAAASGCCGGGGGSSSSGAAAGVSSGAATAAAAATGMLLHIKSYDRWTKRLVDLIEHRGVNITVKIEGPYAELPGAVLGHPEVPPPPPAAAAAVAGGDGGDRDGVAKTAAAVGGGGDHHAAGVPDGLIIAAGGVGATAAMSVFQEMATAGEAASKGLPTLLVWCCRKADELEFLAPRLFAMAHTLGLSLTVRLFCTGDPASTSGAAMSTAAAAANGSSTNANSNKPAAAHGTAATSRRNISNISSSSSSGGHLVTSSMCPVVGLSSFWCQVGHKTLLHVIAFAGACAAILLARYLAVVKPASAGLEPWTTGQKGSALVALISACILVPGLLALWAALWVQAWQQRSGSSGSSGVSKAAAGGSNGSNGAIAAVLPVSTSVGGAASASAAGSNNKKSDRGKKGKCDLTSHLLAAVEDGIMSPADTPTAAEAAAAAAANPLAPTTSSATASYNTTSSSLSAVAAAAVAAGRFATIRAAAGGGWELVLPEPAADAAEGLNDAGAHAVAAVTYEVAQGRPPLKQLVAGWLSTLQQLPRDDGSSGGKKTQLLQVGVYGMGPSRLVEDVKLLCDEVNGGSSGGYLGFVQKTHEL